MMNYQRKILLLCNIFFVVIFFCACGRTSSDTLILRVANWEEYVDEGDWDAEEEIVLGNGKSIYGENSVIQDFEEWFEANYHKKIKVKYSTYGTNEDLYNQLSLGESFDLVCPSEYMIMKLMAEERLLPFSEAFYRREDSNNYYSNGVSKYIDQTFSEQVFDGKSLKQYAAGYMWGNLGVVYNPKYISAEEAEDWNFYLDEKYRKRITVKDSVRDCYFMALGMLTQDEVMESSFLQLPDYRSRLSERLNDTDEKRVEEIGEILSRVKKNVYSFETDSGKSDLVSGKVYANLQWSGDAVYSIQQAKEDGVELKYAVPKASTNLWFDGWCMLRDGIADNQEKQMAAEAFVNFLSKPDIVVRNMYYIGYTSAIAGGSDDTIFQYADYCYGEEDGKEEYDLGYFFGQEGEQGDYIIHTNQDITAGELFSQYPPEEVGERSVIMAYLDSETNDRINRMWVNVRCFELPF